jgi:hypothetical protein
MNKGDKVYFGRNLGEKTLGEILKVNLKTYKIQQLEARGSYKSYPVGSVWNVAKNLVTPATDLPLEGAKEATISRLASELASKQKWERTHRRPFPKASFAQQALHSIKTQLEIPSEAPKPARAADVVLVDIRSIYNQLSPENLSCDGELSRSAQLQRSRFLNGKLRELFREIGRPISESEAYGS